MLPASDSTTSATREDQIRALVEQLRPAAEASLRRMAERLLDAPDHQLFGRVELDLRDLGHDLAAAAHHAALNGPKKKRATRAPASPAPAAGTTPSSSTTSPAP